MIGKIIAVALLTLWLFMIIKFAWSNKVSRLHNIVYGVVIFVFIGMCYCLPMWLLFMR